MSRALVIFLGLNMATASDPFEWKGVFLTPEGVYKWGAQKKGGKYADPTMKLAAIPVAAATEAALTSATSKGKAAMGTTCVEVTKDTGKIRPAENKCYKLVFDDTSSETIFTVDADNAGAIAFFAEHFPTEFEDTAHYFKDSTGVDIEPQAQAPDPGSGGHSHGHGNTFEGKCVCQAQAHGWKLDCSNKAKIEQSVANLEANVKCKAKNPPQEPCIDNYYLMQAHHDHCLHNQLPMGIEKKLHDYEHFYSDCYIKRQFNPSLKACPAVVCTNAQAMTTAIATLQTANKCNTKAKCASSDCSAAIKLVLMAHDTCSEKQLPNNLETALHDYEDHCEAELCNSASAAFDPCNEKCAGPTTAVCAKGSTSSEQTSGGFGSKGSFLVTISALIVAVPLF